MGLNQLIFYIKFVGKLYVGLFGKIWVVFFWENLVGEFLIFW